MNKRLISFFQGGAPKERGAPKEQLAMKNAKKNLYP